MLDRKWQKVEYSGPSLRKGNTVYENLDGFEELHIEALSFISELLTSFFWKNVVNSRTTC